MLQLVCYFEVALETVLVLWRITLQDCLRDVFWPSFIFNLIIGSKKIKALYLSVNVFSTKVLIGDTIFNISYWRRGIILRGHPSIGPALWIKILTSYSAVKHSADWANPALVKKSITSQKQSKSAIWHNPNHTKTSKRPVVSCNQSTPPTDGNPAKMGCKAAYNNNQST